MYYTNIRKYLTLFLFIILAILLITYGYYQSKNLIGGPQLYIDTPKNGEVFEKSLVEIKGKAENISKLTLNDEQIFIDENGVFAEKLLLLEGYNIITIQAEDKFDRTVKKELELVLIEEKPTLKEEALEVNLENNERTE